MQGLRGAVVEQDAPPFALLLPSWARVWGRLAMDNSHAVRQEAASTMAAFAAKAGRQMTPYLKVLVGPWWQLSFDLDSRATAQPRLRGLKQLETLLFCRNEVCPAPLFRLHASADYIGSSVICLSTPSSAVQCVCNVCTGACASG